MIQNISIIIHLSSKIDHLTLLCINVGFAPNGVLIIVESSHVTYYPKFNCNPSNKSPIVQLRCSSDSGSAYFAISYS